MYQGVTTVELDNLAAETAAYMTVSHPDYAILAARITISNLHKETKKQVRCFVSCFALFWSIFTFSLTMIRWFLSFV